MFELIQQKLLEKISGEKINNTNLLEISLEELFNIKPELKERFFSYSDDFKKLKDPFVFKLISGQYTLKSFATKIGLNPNKLLEDLLTFNPSNNKNKRPDWVENIEFVEIDARKLSGFFLKEILKKLDNLEKGKGLKVIQNFYAAPLITLIESKGHESYTEKISEELYNFYFYKEFKEEIKGKPININTTGKPELVIQSATPVVYPIMIKMLTSEEIKKNIIVKETKVWEETEKHLGWIVNGKADLSFSAVLAMSNLVNNKDIVQLSAITVWDNFYLLTRGFEAKDWKDLLGKEIYMPLFFNAPPAKITYYLMKEAGYNPKDFNFVFGKPFGRPEEIYRDLVAGKIDAALLREPEASYALVNNLDVKCSISYSAKWKEIHPESFGLPNAGVVLKKEWAEKFPNEAKLINLEIEKATDWVKRNKDEAARISYKEMGHSFEEVLKFVNRVHYDYVPANKSKKEIFDYLAVIEGEERASAAIKKMIKE